MDCWLVENVVTYLSIRGIITVSLVPYNCHLEKAYRVTFIERLELPIHSKLMRLDSRMRGSMGRDSWATRLRLPVRRFELQETTTKQIEHLHHSTDSMITENDTLVIVFTKEGRGEKEKYRINLIARIFYKQFFQPITR